MAQANQGLAPGVTSVGEQAEQAEREKKEKLQEVVVTGRYQFLGADTSGTTNLPLPIEQVPQSISLVSNDFIQAADLKTLGAIAEYNHARTTAALFETSNRGKVQVTGKDAGSFLHNLCTNDIANMPMGAVQICCMRIALVASVLFASSTRASVVGSITSQLESS